MTVRQKLVMLITIAGFVPTFIFSIIIFFEMLEQPFQIIDHNLYDMGVQSLKIILRDKRPNSDINVLFTDNRLWLEVRKNESGKLIFRSKLASLVPLRKHISFIKNIINVRLPKRVADLNQDRNNEVTFYVKNFIFSYNNKDWAIKIAYPMERLQEEIWDIVIGISSGLLLSLIILISVSYFVAGLILKPVIKMDSKIKFITEKNLHKRLDVKFPMDEFDKLSYTLNNLFERLELSFINQKQLLADASHELKTPITMMRFAVEELKNSELCEDDEIYDKNIERLNLLNLRMDQLIKNILDLSALEKGDNIMTKDIDLVEIIVDLIEDYSILGASDNIEIISFLPSKLIYTGDPEKLRRAFSNLLDNALKYNLVNGYIKISGVKTSSMIKISIENSGKGIPGDELEKIFMQFYRVEKSRAKEHGGSGLGLSIVKKIIENHGGRIFLKSELGKVITFIELPVDG